MSASLAMIGCTDSETESSCAARREVLRADVDGDDRTDTVWRDQVGDDLFVGVCTASEVETRVAVLGMGEGEFLAIDIDQDGRSEILSGGTTVSQRLSELLAFVGGELRVIPDLILGDGLRDSDEHGVFPLSMEQWGCDDVDGNGMRDLVLVTVTRGPIGAIAERVAYRISGASATRIARDEHQLDEFPEFNDRVVNPC